MGVTLGVIRQLKTASFPKLQLPSDRTKPTFENKGTRPEPGEGENRVEKAHGKKSNMREGKQKGSRTKESRRSIKQ